VFRLSKESKVYKDEEGRYIEEFKLNGYTIKCTFPKMDGSFEEVKNAFSKYASEVYAKRVFLPQYQEFLADYNLQHDTELCQYLYEWSLAKFKGETFDEDRTKLFELEKKLTKST
jgi:hypothetical protein